MTLILAAEVFADVYRTVDKNGNAIFTDKNSPDAEKIKMQKTTTTIDSLDLPDLSLIEGNAIERGERNGSSIKELAQASYAKLEITNPKNDQVFTNIDNMTVSVVAQPQLNTANGDHFILNINGKKMTTSNSPSFGLTDITRGTHEIEVYIANKNGESLVRSAPVSFTVKRHTILLPKKPSTPSTN